MVWIDPSGLKPYITLTLSAGGSLAVLGLEGGNIFALDPECGQLHGYQYMGAGPGLGMGGAATAQIGLMDMDDPQALAGFGLEVTGFAAAAHGIAGQLTGTGQSSVGDYAFGTAYGYAAGGGAGITGMVTHTWHQGTWDLNDLPSDVSDLLQPYLPGMLGQCGPWQ